MGLRRADCEPGVSLFVGHEALGDLVRCEFGVGRMDVPQARVRMQVITDAVLRVHNNNNKICRDSKNHNGEGIQGISTGTSLYFTPLAWPDVRHKSVWPHPPWETSTKPVPKRTVHGVSQLLTVYPCLPVCGAISSKHQKTCKHLQAPAITCKCHGGLHQLFPLCCRRSSEPREGLG